MKRAPLLVFLTLWLGGIAIVALTCGGLPAQVATHFGVDGRPNGWMSRTTHTAVMLALAGGMPAVIAAVFGAIQFLPDSLINLPSKDYWLAPERRAESLGWLTSAGLWFASLDALFFLGVDFLVLQANAQSPPRLSNGIWIMLAVMLGGLLWLVAGILRRFWRPEDSPA